MRNRKFKPIPGRIYSLRNGSEYRCLWAESRDNGEYYSAGFIRDKDGWELTAHDVQRNEDGTIEWHYSTGGHWNDESDEGDEGAWQVGHNRILAVQTCEDGYDYTIYDENYIEVDGGCLENPNLAMLEARNMILESFGLEHGELRSMVYEDVMEQVAKIQKYKMY